MDWRSLAVTGAPEWAAVAVSVLGVLWRVAHNARASARRQGERIGVLEQAAKAAELRRYQVEAMLLRAGIDLPPWPDGPHPRDLVDLDEDDDLATTQLATQHFSRHHLTRRTP